MSSEEKQRSDAELLYVLEQVFSVQGLAAAAALSAPLLLGALVPAAALLLVLLYAAVVAGYYFLIVQHMGSWAPGLPNPANRGSGLLSALTKGLALLIPALVPAFLFALFTWTPPHEVLTNPWARTFTMVAAAFYLPAAVTAGAVGTEAGSVLWLPNWGRVIRADPRGYARLTLRFLIISCTWAFTTLITALLFGRVPVFGSLIVGTVSNLLLFVQAGTVGIYAGNNARVLGFVRDE